MRDVRASSHQARRRAAPARGLTLGAVANHGHAKVPVVGVVVVGAGETKEGGEGKNNESSSSCAALRCGAVRWEKTGTTAGFRCSAGATMNNAPEAEAKRFCRYCYSQSCCAACVL